MTHHAAQVEAPPPAAAEDSELAQVIRAYNDVTERLQRSHEKLQDEVLRLRQELASTNAQLQRSKRLSALGEMAAGIAHEIRNPLGAIQLYADMALADLQGGAPDAAEAAENARKIASAVHGLNGIVNDVLSFAREIEPATQPLDASELFDRVLDAHRPAIDAAAVAVERTDRDRDPLEVEADPNLLHQALLNLVRNAVDAMAASPRRVLTLDATPDAGGAALTVADTGPGIAREHVDRIFNPFFTTRNAGTGLGLAIVHRIVDAHGGAIVADNRAGDGSGAVFTLSLPVQGVAA